MENIEREELTHQERQNILDSIGSTVTLMRHEAVKGRKSSDIESIWSEDENYYQGIDEHNGSGDGNWSSKPPGQAAPASRGAGSTVFLNVTGPYCDIASARMGDMLLPTDEPAFSINHSPIPELVDMANGDISDEILQKAIKHTKKQEEEARAGLQEQASSEIEKASEIAKKAQKQINDWLVQCQYQSQVRTVLDDIARCGSGVLKGPVPEERKTISYIDGELKVSKSIEPCSMRVDYWNCFPDPSCGDNHHNGSFFWERDEITGKKLRSLKGSGLYFDNQIDRVLTQDSKEVSSDYDKEAIYIDRGLKKSSKASTYQIWYGYVTLLKKDVELLDLELDEEEDSVDIKITMVNNVVIQLDRNTLDTGEFPYDIMVWKKRKNSPFGAGVARLIRTSQRVINAAARSLMDNSGIASGPMWLVNQGLIEPINGVNEIAPLKGWKLAEDADLDDARKAFSYFTIPMMQEDLQAIINLGLSFAEQVTGIPLILQGHTGSSPDTVGGMRMLQNNASTTLRRIAKIFDDLITEPHMRRYYAFLLQYGPDETKGDFQIDAKGSSALVERDIQNESIMGMMNLVQNPVFGIDPKKWIKELLASQRLDYSKFEYDDEQWEQIVAQMSQPQSDPRVEIEGIRQQAAKQKLASDQERDNQKMQFQAEKSERENQFKMMVKQIDIENKTLIESGKQELTAAQIQSRYQEHLEKLQSSEAETMLKLQVQQSLSTQKSPSGTIQVSNPPTEPEGRAPNGMAYQL